MAMPYKFLLPQTANLSRIAQRLRKGEINHLLQYLVPTIRSVLCRNAEPSWSGVTTRGPLRSLLLSKPLAFGKFSSTDRVLSSHAHCGTLGLAKPWFFQSCRL